MSLDRRSALQTLIQAFTPEALTGYLRAAAPTFRPQSGSFDAYLQEGMPFDRAQQVGVIELPAAQTVLVAAVHTPGELISRLGKKVQYDLAKALIKAHNSNAGLLAFYDDAGHFRFSLVTAHYYGTSRQFSNFRRYTFFVAPDAPNKTFVNQIGRADFSSMESILKAFSIEALSEDFYKEFKPRFDAIAQSVAGKERPTDTHEDFALLFVIRTIFLGFVQKKGWLGSNPRFLQAYWNEYQAGSEGQNRFYREWLEPLFFEALNAPPGRKVAYGHAPFSPATQQALQMAPYLNGELFKRKREVDDQGLEIPDAQISAFFDFLFQYNFTVEENELYDEELELNPEFLGIIFERLTNQDQGAVYTPRVEVDLMCRLALVKWLEGVTAIGREDLYRFFFREAGTGEAYDEYQKQGDFSPAEIRVLVERLSTVAACDPAAGSGAFEVGMLQVLDQALANLYSRDKTPADLKNKALTPFKRKKAIIANSLYGVEVKRWAVWINHLRLWLSLFVDMPDEDQTSLEPLLPNLTFKVRVGDSLVQRVGDKTFPVQEHAAALPPALKKKITDLKQRKRYFFYNASDDYRPIAQAELDVFRAILDAQIETCRAEIATLLAPQPKQGELPSLGPKQAELDLAAATAARRAALQAEIAALEAQKRTLHEERPLIWSIEFAEIFFDRGGFDIIIGNPPYVRQEDISDPNGHLTPRAYKAALREMLLLDFPDYFAPSRAKADTFKKDRKPSGRSDLYTYFYIRSLRLLNPQGVHVFICSNSWLDVGYGAWLQEFFLRQAPLHFVIDNHARRSFASADINTVITVAGASRKVGGDHRCKFVAFKQPFENVVLSDNLLEIERTTATQRDDMARIFPITAAALLAEGSEMAGGKGLRTSGKYVGDKWGGKYLRAPDIFFTILEKGAEKLVRLGDIAEVMTGCYSGLNDFFYVTKKTTDEFRIEPDYLVALLKSSSDVKRLEITSTLRMKVVSIPSIRRERLGAGVKSYIQWGEKQVTRRRQKTAAGIPWPKTSTVSNRTHWYAISERQLTNANLFMQYVANDRFYCPFSPEDGIVSDRAFHRILPKGNIGVFETSFVLNSTLATFFVMLLGRSNLGQGALKFETTDAKRMSILDPRLAPSDAISVVRVLGKREPQSVFIECGLDPESDIPIAEQEPQPLPDRKALDDIVFDALDLTDEERKEVYRAVCQLVWNRLSKAKST